MWIHAEIYTRSCWNNRFSFSREWSNSSRNRTTCNSSCRWPDNFATDWSVGCCYAPVRCWCSQLKWLTRLLLTCAELLWLFRLSSCCHVRISKMAASKYLRPCAFHLRSRCGPWEWRPYIHRCRATLHLDEQPCRLSCWVLWTELDHSL